MADPATLDQVCFCGLVVHPVTRFNPRRLESDVVLVCERGHVTAIERRGQHTYDQRERALAELRRKEWHGNRVKAGVRAHLVPRTQRAS